MDFLIEEKTFDLGIMKSMDMFESNISDFLFSMVVESVDPVIEKSTFQKFIDKACIVMENILDLLKEFFVKLRTKIDIKLQQISLNKKLEELKDIMAKKKSKALNRKFDYFDIKKYKSYYKDYINRYTAELKKGLNREFKSVKEYEAWRMDMEKKMADFNFKLSDEEQWTLSTTINSAVELSKKEAENLEKNLKMVEKDGSDTIKNLEEYYKTMKPKNSYVNYKPYSFEIFKMKHSFLGLVVSKIAQAIKTVARIITKHTFACVTTLLVLLIAL